MAAVIKISIESNASGGGFADAKKGIADLDSAARKGGDGFTVLKGLAVNALSAVASAAASAVGAVAGFVKDSVSAAGTFESAVNGMAAVSGSALADAGYNLDDVSAKALQLGKDTQYSAQEAIVAMTELVKGGVPIASVMTDATDATLALAAAADMDLGPAAEIVAKQLGVWADTGVTAAQVTDLLASAANASTVDVQELSMGLAQAGGTARTMGLDYAELVTSLAMVSSNFASASDAGTSFKTFLTRLAPSTEPAKEAMADLGLYTEEAGSAFFDANGQFIGARASFELLQEATANLSEEEKILAFNAIFGADAIRFADAAARKGGEGYDEMTAAMEASGGAAAVAAAKQQGYAFAMEQFTGSVETAQIILGSAFLPMLTQAISVGTEWVNALAEIFETFGKMVPAIQSSEDPIRAFLTAIMIAVPGTGAWVGPLIDVYLALQTLFSVITGGTPNMDSLMFALTAMAKHLGLPIPIVASVVSALQSFYAMGQQLAGFISDNLPVAIGIAQAAFTTIQGVITTVMASVVPAVQTGLAMIQSFWQANGAQIMAFVQTTWATIQTIITTALQVIWAIIQPMLQNWTDGVATHGTGIQQILTNVWTIISSVITAALALIQGILQTTLAVIQGDWQGAWAAIQAMSVTFTVALGDIIYAFLDTIAALFGNTMDNIVSQVTAGWGFVQTNTAKGAALVMKAIQDAFARAPDIGRALIDGIKNGINGALGGLVAAAAAAAKRALDAAKSALGIRSPSAVFANEVGRPIAQGMAAGIAEGASLVAAAGAALAQQAVSGAQSALSAVGAGLMAAGSAAGSGGGMAASPSMLSAGADVWGRATGGGNNNSRNVTNNFTLNSTSNAKTSTLLSDFRMMRTLAGVMK